MMKAVRTFLATLLMWLPLAAAADTYLLMAEEEGCIWCARWDAEIADIYPKTVEGKAAPLVRYDKRGEVPEGVALESPVRFTPTFILVKDGVEAGRIEGYPGEDFFWGLLGMLLQRAQILTDTTTG